jgi:hypothetical protein
MQDAVPHAAVAERFRYFLDATELTRDAFAGAVAQAVNPRTLYALLSGRRRPSRALAVLIERQWGYRADYLLDGRGAMWREPARKNRELSEDEAAVLAFMAESVDNARALRRDLDDAALWARLWARTNTMLDALEATTETTYPAAARQAFAECIEVAERFAELKAARGARRNYHLITAFIARFLRKVDVAHVLEIRTAAEARLETREAHLRDALEARAESPPRDPETHDTELSAAVETLRAKVDTSGQATALNLLAQRAGIADLDALLAEIAEHD